MIFNLKFLFLSILCINFLFANSDGIDSLTLSKIKKLVEKEESIAIAYKKYLLKVGTNPSTIKELKDASFLPKGFDTINPFGKEISLILDENSTTTNKKDDKHKIRGFESSDPILKSNLYDYYYSNKYRTYTKAPLSINNSNIEIILSSKEKFIYENKEKITTTTATANKYLLDSNSVLHWYDSTTKYKYSFDKELLLDSSVNPLNANGTINSTYKELVKDVMFAGLTVLYKKDDNTTEEYISISDNSIIKVKNETRDIGKTIIQFTRRAGGMIVNGDIYTWGNNANKITGINLGYSGSTGSNRYPVITGLVRAKAKMYDNDSTDGKDFTQHYTQNYFSSPNRPKFIDFHSTVYTGTCGISTKGELYCGGIESAINKEPGDLFTEVDSSRKAEMLYRSTFFDGKINKAKKIFANNEIWNILSEDGTLYSWGSDYRGFSANGDLNFNSKNCTTVCTQWLLVCLKWENICSNEPKNIFSGVKFLDITYLLTIGHRKIAGLSTTGDIYIWGIEYLKDGLIDSYEQYNCSVSWDGKTYNLCLPTKVETTNSTMTSTLKFESVQGGLDAFIARDTLGKYYKISHPKLKKIQVLSVDTTIQSYSEYKASDDTEILSVDFSRKISDTDKSKPSTGIVWVNSKYELKGDYFTSSNKDDKIFKNAIKKIKWKKIKVIDDDNGMCGIDTNNQMYCWGIQSFYRNGSSAIDYMGNTFMIPVFNTNLYDSNKDFLVAEGGSNGYLTNMTSEVWETTNSAGKTGAFFMKYPTYIGGFNYEFIFK